MSNLPRHGLTEKTYRTIKTLPRFVAPLYGAWKTEGRRFLEIRPLAQGGSKISIVRYP